MYKGLDVLVLSLRSLPVSRRQKKIMLLYLVGGSLGLLGTIWFLFDYIFPKKFTSRKRGVPDKPIEYKLDSAKFPRITGTALRIVKWLSKTGLKTLIATSSAKRSNLHLLRTIVITDDPTILPLPLPTWKPPQLSEKEVDLEDFLKPSQVERDASFHFLTISDLVQAYRSGKTTPIKVAKNIIRRINQFDEMIPPMRSITQFNESEIIRMAAASSKRYAEGKTLSIFDGIPVVVKEEYSVVPYHCRNGTTFMGPEPCAEDAAIVKKLRDGGAMIVGMSNMHEIGIGVTGSNINSLHGTPRNPYNPQHYTGGSSSGSAAAVASGLCLIGLGTDGGGSIRVPAAACGVVGIKASYGRISTAGVTHIGHSVSHSGHICSNVRDTAMVYAFLAGADLEDPPSMSQPAVSLDGFESTSLEGVTLGVDWRFFKDAEQVVVDCCEEALRYLESRGATLVDLQIPELEESRVAHTVTILVEMAAALEPCYYENHSKLNPESVLPLSLGRTFTALDYYQAQKQRTRAMQFLQNIFQGENVDCIITPGLAIKVPRIPSDALSHGEANTNNVAGIMKFFQLGNLTGVPGMTLPVGYDGNDLPISLQVMSGWWQEHVMLRVAHACEGFVGRRKPEVYCDISE